MKTREQRRKRRPLTSIFVGQAPQKTEPSGFCLMPLAHYGCPIDEKAS